MKWLKLIPLTLLLVVLGAGCFDRDVVTRSELRQNNFGAMYPGQVQTPEQWEQTEENITVRGETESRLESRLDSWYDDYLTWSMNMDIAIQQESGELQTTWTQTKEAVEERYQTAVMRLEEVKDATSDGWAQARTKAEDAIDALQDYYLEQKIYFSTEITK